MYKVLLGLLILIYKEIHALIYITKPTRFEILCIDKKKFAQDKSVAPFILYFSNLGRAFYFFILTERKQLERA